MIYWLRIFFSPLFLLAVALFVGLVMFHDHLESHHKKNQEERDAAAAALIFELEAKCEAAWPKDASKCKRRARLLVRNDI